MSHRRQLYQSMVEQRSKEPPTEKHKDSSSKYDFVKVRVWLKDPLEGATEHYYVLSRFLVSRMLAVTQMQYRDAIRLALELKKRLVDRQRLDLTQEEVDAQLFDLMRANGYGGAYIDRFQMMSAFHQQRVPLLVTISGTGCCGKSILATQLSERLNMPNIVQTDWLHMLLRPNGEGSSRLWMKRYPSTNALLDDYEQQALAVRDAIQADLTKAHRDGKALVVEGLHVDPFLFEQALPDDGVMVVVPFILVLDPSEQAQLVSDWLACQRADAPTNGVDSEPMAPRQPVDPEQQQAGGMNEIEGAAAAAMGGHARAHAAINGGGSSSGGGGGGDVEGVRVRVRDGGGDVGGRSGRGGGSGGFGGAAEGGGVLSVEEMLDQLGALQQHIERQGARCRRLRPRLMRVSTHAVDWTLDALHAEVLERIELGFYHSHRQSAPHH